LVLLFALSLLAFAFGHLHHGREGGGEETPPAQPKVETHPLTSIIDDKDIKELERLLEETKKYWKI
jgi:hypothetical protein